MARTKYEKLTDLALRRGFFFPTAEIYAGTPAGFWDYGPLGAALKRKYIELWRKLIVQRDGMIEIDGAVTLPEVVYKSSGHLTHFVDPLIECEKCKTFHRADKLLGEKLKRHVPEALPEKEFDRLVKESKIKCPKCKSGFGPTKKFNMMFTFTVGPHKEEVVGLRPETCQNIFIDFPRLYKVMRAKLPVAIAQAGRAFRNEISPRQGLLRTREFSQAEIEVFFHSAKANDFPKFDEIKNYKLKLMRIGKNKIEEIKAGDAVKKRITSSKLTAYYLAILQQFYETIGLTNVRFREVDKDERAFYAKETWDFEINTSVGWIECVACNYRGDYDLSSHAKGSGENVTILDGEEKVIPHVFELSMGIDRSLYCSLENSLAEEKVKKETRNFLKLKPELAPFFVAVFPLVSKDKLPEKAQKVYELLRSCYDTFYDDSGAIGRRYRRMDEVGTPFCITIDHKTLEDNTVTVRERDSMAQKRVKIEEIVDYLYKKVYK